MGLRPAAASSPPRDVIAFATIVSLRNGSIDGLVPETIMFNAFAAVIGGRSGATDPAEELWDLILNGVRSR